MILESKSKQKNCSKCGAAFGCTNTESDGRCWCDLLPPIFSPDSATDCLCPACLKDKINEYLESLSPEDVLKYQTKGAV